jgi:hypothetical protein
MSSSLETLHPRVVSRAAHVADRCFFTDTSYNDVRRPYIPLSVDAETAVPVVLVDARNVMRSRWPNLRATRLLESIRMWAAREGVRPLVVFDGPAPRDRPRDLEVFGTMGESADDWIAREAERLFDEGRVLWLVSSDRGLRERVSSFVERTIGGGTFAGELEALER